MLGSWQGNAGSHAQNAEQKVYDNCVEKHKVKHTEKPKKLRLGLATVWFTHNKEWEWIDDVVAPSEAQKV